jgi:hypothetical protein
VKFSATVNLVLIILWSTNKLFKPERRRVLSGGVRGKKVNNLVASHLQDIALEESGAFFARHWLVHPVVVICSEVAHLGKHTPSKAVRSQHGDRIQKIK